MRYRAFIQARMTSDRLPGKVLMPLNGEPLISHVISHVARLCPRIQMVVLTSVEASDDPLALYVESLGVTVFRGSLHNVFERFIAGVETYPCDWILRLSADSPFLETDVIQRVLEHMDEPDLDLITTTFPRTFPKGHNAELINVETFRQIDAAQLTDHEREHVTAHFYANADHFRIKNIESGKPELADTSYAIDSLEDYRRLAECCSSVGDCTSSRNGSA